MQVIYFISPIHGSGRTTLAEKLAKILKEKGYKVKLIKAGERFREIAKKLGFHDIDEFEDYLYKNLKAAEEIETSVDTWIREEIQKSKDADYIIVDSNVSYLYGPKGKVFLVYTSPDKIGERVFRKHRFMDKRFASPQEAFEDLLERTKRDLEIYNLLCNSLQKHWLKEVYCKGSKIMDELLHSYLRGNLREAAEKYGFELIDNSKSLEEALKEILKRL